MAGMKHSNRSESLIHSYLAMRRIVGVLAILLPVIMVAGGFIQKGSTVEGSISSYYYTNMRDFFVGMLSGVALFLISYKGYELIDDIVTNLSGIFALGIIAFPTSKFAGHVVRVGIFLTPDNISQYIHLAFSIAFLFLLAFNSLFLFTRHGGAPSREKKTRNFIYRTSGWIMIACIVGMVLYIAFLSHSALAKWRPVLVFETVSLISFGISWLVKGNTLFKDKRLAAAK